MKVTPLKRLRENTVSITVSYTIEIPVSDIETYFGDPQTCSKFVGRTTADFVKWFTDQWDGDTNGFLCELDLNPDGKTAIELDMDLNTI